jgi:hypothetical protein
MDARKVAAYFAAHAWYEESRAGQPAPDEAARFATENWTAFLTVAHEGWGRLLLRRRLATGERTGQPGAETAQPGTGSVTTAHPTPHGHLPPLSGGRPVLLGLSSGAFSRLTPAKRERRQARRKTA